MNMAVLLEETKEVNSLSFIYELMQNFVDLRSLQCTDLTLSFMNIHARHHPLWIII